jgi:hypothetical protein
LCNGRICQELKTVDQIKFIQKLVSNYNNPLIEDLFWSYPSVFISKSGNNTRNYGLLYGRIAIETFLKINSLQMIIRAHQCIDKGIQDIFSNRVATVFSASHYCGKSLNQSGILLLNESGEIEDKIFPQFKYLRREMVNFDGDILSDSLMSKILPNYHNVDGKKKTLSSQIIFPFQNKRQQFQRKSFRNPLVSNSSNISFFLSHPISLA